MNDTKQIEVTLSGIAKLVIRDSNNKVHLVETLIKVPAIRLDDWQCDGGYWHNEGGYEIDYNSLQVVYPDEYNILYEFKYYPEYNTKVEGKECIKQVVKIIDDSNLTEN